MAKVTAITPINHDGVLYKPGDSFDCTKAQAEQLCALGSAKMAEEASETKSTPKAKKNGK